MAIKTGNMSVSTAAQYKEALTANADAFFTLVRNKFKFGLFLFSKLPSAYFAGVRVRQASEESCTVTVPYKWFSQNPFRSTYFACLAMAAEMTTGLLGLAPIYRLKPGVSMLVVKIEGDFMKKAGDVSTFSCTDGLAIRETILRALQTGEAQSIRARSTGVNKAGEPVADFYITWSFKAKQSR
jgi:hypothetical protein